MKTYILIYEDHKGNELTRKEITAFNIKEARKYKDRIFADCMINDCKKITVNLIVKRDKTE